MGTDISDLFGTAASEWELAMAAALNLQSRTTAAADLELIAQPARERVAVVLRKLQALPKHWSQELGAQLLSLEREL